MSEKCQDRTHAPRQSKAYSDYEQFVCNSGPERSCSLEVDDWFASCWLHGQRVSGFFTFEDHPADIDDDVNAQTLQDHCTEEWRL
jgi:hypothetical protein